MDKEQKQDATAVKNAQTVAAEARKAYGNKDKTLGNTVYNGAHTALPLEYIRPDGVAVTRVAEETTANETRTERYADGSLMMAYKDGRVRTQNKDGTYQVVSADGKNVSYHNPDGTEIDRRSYEKGKDSNVADVTTAANRKKSPKAPAATGSVVPKLTNKDGSTSTLNNDGSITVTYQNGKTATHPAGSNYVKSIVAYVRDNPTVAEDIFMKSKEDGGGGEAYNGLNEWIKNNSVQ